MSFDRKAYMKEYRDAHREHINEQARKYYANDPEKYRKRSSDYRKNNKEKVAEYNHDYWIKTRDDGEFRDKRKAWMKNYRKLHQEGHRIESAEQRKNHKDEYEARIIVNHAIRDGKLERSPCEKCGEEIAEAHHDDYNYPLKVRWLCNRCHTLWHRENKPIRKRKEAI